MLLEDGRTEEARGWFKRAACVHPRGVLMGYQGLIECLLSVQAPAGGGGNQQTSVNLREAVLHGQELLSRMKDNPIALSLMGRILESTVVLGSGGDQGEAAETIQTAEKAFQKALKVHRTPLLP